MEKENVLKVMIESTEIPVAIIARRIGVSERTLRYYMEGRMPRVDVAIKIANYFHVTVDSIWR